MERARLTQPDMKMLLTSGYSEIKVLEESYTREQLAHALDEALNS
jgi:hypothetical protein